MSDQGHTQAFELERTRLVALAYRMTGSRVEAEDITQEAWLRWAGVPRNTVDDPAAYLVRVATRLCLDHLKAARTRREVYIGSWLPEPVMDARSLAVDSKLELADDVSFALMVALDQLSPAERAAFLLHDVFDQPFDEVARCLERTPAAARQLASRARRSLQRERQGQPVSSQSMSRESLNALLEAFVASAEAGDLTQLLEHFEVEAVAVSDGGGKVAAAINVIKSGEHIVRFIMGVLGKRAAAGSRVEFRAASLNGGPGLLSYEGDELVQAALFDFSPAGRISTLYMVRNPDKLEWLRRTLARPESSELS